MNKEKFSNINSETFFGKITEDGKFEQSTPLETTITMKVDDISTKEIFEKTEEKPKQEYDKLLLKVSWFLKGLDNDNEYLAELIEEIEDFI